MAKHYRVSIDVTVEDEKLLFAAARAAGLGQGFVSGEEYDTVRSLTDDAVAYDLMELIRVENIDMKNGICPGELSVVAVAL